MELDISNSFYKFGDLEKLTYSLKERVDVNFRLFKNFYIFARIFMIEFTKDIVDGIKNFNLFHKAIHIKNFFETVLYNIFYYINKISLNTGQIYLSILNGAWWDCESQTVPVK
jgi:hypothetical protein